MKKEIRQVQYMKPVVEDREVFITNDNKQFYTEKEALEHEQYLITEEQFKNKYNLSKKYIIDREYDIVVIKELNDAVRYQFNKKYKKLDVSKLIVGINLIHEDDSGDYWYQEVYYIDDLIKEQKEGLDELEQIKKEKGY